PMGENSLYVAYYASAEMGCHLALDWTLPDYLLDLFCEFRCQTNGLSLPAGNGLLGALSAYGLEHIPLVEKEELRQLALRGGPYNAAEQVALLDYCQSDVDALVALLPKMSPEISIEHALIRGRYTQAVARMESVGIPMDLPLLERLQANWDSIQDDLIEDVDKDYGVFEGRVFKNDLFSEYLSRHQMAWPRLPSGNLDLQDKTFRSMAKIHPQLSSLRELRHSLNQMRLNEFRVSLDGRNRTLISPFQSKTGRNQPSNSRYIFGSSVWLRGLIKPAEGWGIAYIDWSQQEFGIAAALSGDEAMMRAYASGDPYLEFAKLAGAVPSDATKKSHPKERALFKATVLAVQYGMGAEALAERIQQPVIVAKDLLRKHRQTFQTFWEWSDRNVDYALLHNRLWTVFGWQIQVAGQPNPRSLANFLMQANGAEMLRIACVLMTEAGIRVCAPVHDALLIEAPLEELDERVGQAQELMREASRQVLGDFELTTDADIYRYPERYRDEERGGKFWDKVMDLLSKTKFS
ncbi:MAG: DNA polymerase, partial [Deltaproteobacteria bacterium]